MTDLVNSPPHYKDRVPGIECIEVTQHFDFLRGNAIKYCWRQGLKGSALEDLKKAVWYIERELSMYVDERWGEWPEDRRYEVSTFGNVRRVGSKVNRIPVRLKNGYLTIGRAVDGEAKTTYVHRMVMETWEVYPIPASLQVCHIDGRRENCHRRNLRIDTVSGNAADRRWHGTHYVGGQNPASRLTATEVEEIRALTGPESKIAAKFGVSRSTIGRIRRGEAWADPRPHLDRLLDECEKHFTGDIGEAMRHLWRAGAKGDARQDLQKAKWYIQRELDSLAPPAAFGERSV